MDDELIQVLERAKERPIGREEALFLFRHTEGDEEAAALFAAARAVRDKVKGRRIRMTGGIASVLRCDLKPNCIYCPYWRELGKDPLSIDEILKAVEYITSHGIRDFHLSGGTTLGSDGADILAIVRAIDKAGFHDVEIDVNCGAAMSLDTLLELKELRVKMVRSVFETLNPKVFARMKPGDSLEAKKRFAQDICDAGIGFGTGILAGLSPQETKYEDYVDFLFQIKGYPRLKSLYVSKFYPFNGILLKDRPACSAREAGRVVAVARLVLPEIDIGGAQGWWATKGGPTSLEAGGGNSALGIHIDRTPGYIDTEKAAREEGFEYRDGMEFRNTIAQVEQYYKEQGMEIYY
ncbi:radical SAM protein [Pseudoflavonifractor sp. MSJ-37]|nr:radical SAM protein [Pseudoflavonifractor sp. MSJ-37]